MHLAIASVHDLGFLVRQTPAGDGVWDELAATFDTGTPHDWLIVVDDPPDDLFTRLPPSRRLLVLTEPPAVRRYPPAFLAQFGTVLGPTAPPGFSGQHIACHACLPWFYGLAVGGAAADGGAARDWPTLANGPACATESRNGVLSAVCSTKKVTVNQIRRLRFLAVLQGALGDRLTLFGRGFAPLDDKAEGIDGYRYHLVLENNLDPGFWTEKLADPILGGAFPIVAGGGGLDRWFDPAGFREIDITRPRAAVAAVEAILADDPVSRAPVRAALAENRRRLMNEHQLFPVLARILGTAGANDTEPLLPEAAHVTRAGHTLATRIDRALRPVRLAAARLAISLTERD